MHVQDSDWPLQLSLARGQFESLCTLIWMTYPILQMDMLAYASHACMPAWAIRECSLLSHDYAEGAPPTSRPRGK